MLVRQTILYLPAQLLPAAAQFLSLILWSHLATPEVLGIVTLYVSIQEFLVLGLMGFWTSYTVRFVSGSELDLDLAARLNRTSTSVVLISSALQALIGFGLYIGLIDPHPRLILIPFLLLMVAGRSFNTFQAERGRARGDILLYSVEVITGPLIGMLVGVGLLLAFGSDELYAFAGFAVAQTAAALFGLARDRSWVVFGRPSLTVLKQALRYGAPLIISSGCAWLTQNTPRLLVSHFFGLAAAGIYSLGFGLGFRVATIAAMSVTAAAFPIAVRFANQGDDVGAMRQLADNAVLLLIVLASSVAGLATVSHDVVRLFIAAPLRAPVNPIMIWALLAGALICTRQHFLHQVFLLKSNTRPIGTVAAIEVVGAVILGFLLVPRWGGLGGILSLAGTSAISMTVMLALAIRTGFKVPWLHFGRIAAATILMALAVRATPPAHNVPGLALRIVAGAAAFVAAMALFYRPLIVARLKAYRVGGGTPASAAAG